MPIYRLEPIEDFLFEQSWRHSLLKTICWVKAPNENEARLAMVMAAAKPPADPASIMDSPWLSPVLVTCIEEGPEFQMEPEIAVSVDGIAQAWTAPAER
jgi:hypothetical protein